MGFAMPLNKWIGAGLESLTGSSVDDRATDDWLDGAMLKRLVATRGRKADRTAQIHSLMFCESGPRCGWKAARARRARRSMSSEKWLKRPGKIR
jgi:hypothetical protein